MTGPRICSPNPKKLPPSLVCSGLLPSLRGPPSPAASQERGAVSARACSPRPGPPGVCQPRRGVCPGQQAGAAPSSALCVLLGFRGSAGQAPLRRLRSAPTWGGSVCRQPCRGSLAVRPLLCLERVTCHTGCSFPPSLHSSHTSSLFPPQVFAPAVPTAWDAFPSGLHLTDLSFLTSAQMSPAQTSPPNTPATPCYNSSLHEPASTPSWLFTQPGGCAVYILFPPHMTSTPWCGDLISPTSVCPAAATVCGTR